MQHFLHFPSVEEEMDDLINAELAMAMLTYQGGEGATPEAVMANYISLAVGRDVRFKNVIGLSGGSLERIKRILAYMFGADVSLSAALQDVAMRKRLARFIVNPNQEKGLPPFIRKEFDLPITWQELLRDKGYMSKVIRGRLSSRYAVRCGLALEADVGRVILDAGYGFEKGRFGLVGKEIDLIAPSMKQPRILVMSSYQLTTSSAQTQRANEQKAMYAKIKAHNAKNSGGAGYVFVNVVDGGGWIARASDLESIWRHCDYCFSHALLGDFGELLPEIMG